MSDPIFTLLINAGGQSERMGQPKALLPVPPHGTPLLHHVIERLQPLVDGATLVIANDSDQLTATGLPAGVQVIPDREAGLGPLGGIIAIRPVDQRGVIAKLLNFAPFEDNDLIGFADGGEAVGDDNRGAVAHQLGKGILDQRFGFRIHRRGCFVEYQDTRVGEDGAGN